MNDIFRHISLFTFYSVLKERIMDHCSLMSVFSWNNWSDLCKYRYPVLTEVVRARSCFTSSLLNLTRCWTEHDQSTLIKNIYRMRCIFG